MNAVITLESTVELVKSPWSSLALLILGIWWLNRKLDRAEARASIEREQAESRVIAERDAFRAERDKRIALLESEVQECRKDRQELHAVVNSLQEEVRGLMRAQIRLSHT